MGTRSSGLCRIRTRPPSNSSRDIRRGGTNFGSVHSDREPKLVCCWYRPPSPGNVDTIKGLELEYNRHKDGAVGVFVLGNLNVQSIRCLKLSAKENVEGRFLCDISNQLGLWQLVKEPAREKYDLDLALSDVPDCTATPCQAVADQKGVLTLVNFKIPETVTHQTEVWHFREADWARMASNIEETN